MNSRYFPNKILGFYRLLPNTGHHTIRNQDNLNSKSSPNLVMMSGKIWIEDIMIGFDKLNLSTRISEEKKLFRDIS